MKDQMGDAVRDKQQDVDDSLYFSSRKLILPPQQVETKTHRLLWALLLQ